jgi:hypothetical protein
VSVELGSAHSRMRFRRTPAARAMRSFVFSSARWGAAVTSVRTSWPMPPRAFRISCRCSRNRGVSVSSGMVPGDGSWSPVQIPSGGRVIRDLFRSLKKPTREKSRTIPSFV